MFKKFFSFFQKYSLLTLFMLFFITRLYNLKIIPIFNDEATYIDWSYRMINLKGEFFHSVAHGKPPLMMWIVGLTRKIIPDPLLAGRLVAIGFGLIGAIGLYKIAKEIYEKKEAVLTFFLYVIIPLFLFYDRQALMESGVAACGIWSLYFLTKLNKSNKITNAILLATSLGLGYLIKTSALIYLIPIIIFLFLKIRKDKQNLNQNILIFIIFLSAYFLILSPLILNSIFWKTLSQNKEYIFSLPELSHIPYKTWLGNIMNFFKILTLYFGPIAFLIGFHHIIIHLFSKTKINMMFVYYFISCVVLSLFLSRGIGPRHLAPFLPIFIIFISKGLVNISNKSIFWGLTSYVLVFTPLFITSILQITNPLRYFDLLTNFSRFSMKDEYVSHWSSGYGFEDVKKSLTDISQKGPIIVGVAYTAGIPENAVIAYFQGSRYVLPIYLDSQIIPNYETYDCISAKIPIYFVSRSNYLAGLDKHLYELKRFYKPEGNNFIGIYKVKEDCKGTTLKIF